MNHDGQADPRRGIVTADAAGRPTLHFERQLEHSVERVWAAITDPAENAAWADGGIVLEPRVGGHITVHYNRDEHDRPVPRDGRITRYEPPHALAWTHDAENGGGQARQIQFELRRVASGACLLSFTDTLLDADRFQADVECLTGWHHMLELLNDALDGRPGDPADIHRMAALAAIYSD